MNSIVRFFIIFLFVVLFFFVETAAQTEATVLEVGKPLERVVQVGETHSYKINAAANQFLHIEVDQYGADVVLKLFSPDGNKLLEVDGVDGVYNPAFIERLYAVTETSGDYRLEIGSVGRSPGGYQVILSELRSSVQADVQIVNALKEMIEGFRLSKGLIRQPLKPPEEPLFAAIEKHRSSILLFQAANYVGGEIDALQHIGEIYWIGLGRGRDKTSSNSLKGLEYWEKSLRLAEKLNEKRRVASALHVLGMALRDSGNQETAREVYDKAFSIYEALGKQWVSGIILLLKGETYSLLGDFDTALEFLQKAQLVADTFPDFPMPSLRIIANLYARKGDLWKSLEYQLRSLKHAERFGGEGEIAAAYMNAGATYYELGNTLLALHYFQKAYEKFAELDRNNPGAGGGGVPTALRNIGAVMVSRGNYAEGLKKYQDALEMFRDRKDPQRIGSVLRSIGDFYLQQDDLTRSLDFFTQASEIQKNLPVKRAYVNTLEVIATCYFRQGNYAETQKKLEEADAVARQIGYFENTWYRNLIFGELYVRLKQPLKARQFFDESIKNAETLRAQGNPFEGMTRPYIEMVKLLSSEGNPMEAFSYAERTKSRSLLDVLQNGKLDITKAMTAEERETETKLKKEMVSLNTQISNEKDKTRLDDLLKQLETKRREFEDFQTRLYALKPELKVQRGEMKPVSLDEAAKLLPDDKSAFLEFVVGEDKSFLFVITKDSAQKVSLKIHPIQIKQEDLVKQTESYRSKIAKGDLDFAKSAQDFYNLLLKPAEAELKNKTNLIIVPDSALWDLPFQTLQTAPNKYLIEQTAISYAPSLTALNEMAKKNRGKNFTGATLLAFGNPTVNKETSDSLKQIFMSESLEPLPEAERLVNSLQKMYGNRSKIFTRNEAREETAKTESSKYRIIQFAAHGVLNDFSPMYSHIVLAQKQGNPNEDGLLEAWEMKDLDLNADMVILSACETARGRVSNGEGVVGMSWALFIAGVPTTVASQWKVESSSTTELMLEFHRQLLSGKNITKAEALRRASLKLMKTNQYKHPSYWAGFVIVGDGF